MTEEDKQNIKEEITSLQNKLDTLINNLGADEAPVGTIEKQHDEDVVQDENIPVVLIDTTTEQEEK